MKTVKNILDKVTSYASVFIFIMMVLMVTYQVVARYIFSAPSSVTEILTRYSFVLSGTFLFICMVNNHICNIYVWTERAH